MEFLENVKVDLFPDEVYLFSPKGQIFSLPRNATALDYAYSVHTDIGNHAVAARVDRKLAPLRTRLNSGETVEIITANSAHPQPQWLEWVVSARARPRSATSSNVCSMKTRSNSAIACSIARSMRGA